MPGQPSLIIHALRRQPARHPENQARRLKWLVGTRRTYVAPAAARRSSSRAHASLKSVSLFLAHSTAAPGIVMYLDISSTTFQFAVAFCRNHWSVPTPDNLRPASFCATTGEGKAH